MTTTKKTNEKSIEEIVARVRFRAADSRFVILVLGDGTSALGEMANPLEGERVRFFGTEETHLKFGKQFKFYRFERVTPVSAIAIKNYIINTARWVGPTVAERLVKEYGDNALEILKTEPDAVAAAISGITIERANEIAATLKGREKEERLAIEIGELCSGRVSDGVIKGAIKRWKENAPDVIREDPYKLTEIHGCGFAGADCVAEGLEIRGQDPRRLAAALVYVLKQAAGRHGHTRVGDNEAEEEAGRLAGCVLTMDGVNEALKSKIVRNGKWYMLARYDSAEREAAGHLRRIMTAAKDLKRKPFELVGCAGDQIAAVDVLESAGVGLLVGPPGVGKTYLLARFIFAFIGQGNRVRFAAPTGIAARRMADALAEVLGDYSGRTSTIHKLLEPTMGANGNMVFTRNESKPIDADYLVLDEVSMLDTELAAQLLAAVPDGCRVLFVGDDHQLPSIGAGAVLRDLIRAEIPTARLTEIKRNKGEIVLACHAIKDGRVISPAAGPLDVDTGHNWRHIALTDTRAIGEQVTWLVSEWAPAKKIDVDDVMVVSPFNHKNQRDLSCLDFNMRLQVVLNKRYFGRGEKAAGGIYRGDRVVRLSNGMAKDADDPDRDIPIVNGDVGYVGEITKKEIVVEFKNPKRKVALRRGDADLALAYALSCHKMQGSEARVIIIPLHKSFGVFPCREWAYTALSRAKDVLITVGSLDVLRSWTRRETNSRRQTGLEDKIDATDIDVF